MPPKEPARVLRKQDIAGKPDGKGESLSPLDTGDKPRSSLTHKLSSVTRHTLQRADRLNGLIGTYQKPQETLPDTDGVSEEELKPSIEGLEGTKPELGEIYILASRPVISKLQILADRYNAEISTLSHQKYDSIDSDLREVTADLEGINSSNWFYKLTKFRERRKLSKQQIELKRQSDDLSGQLQEVSDKSTEINLKLKAVKQHQREALISEVEKEVSEVRSQFVSAYEQITQDPIILNEVRQEYLDRTVRKKVAGWLKEGRVTKEQADEFESYIKDVLSRVDDPQEQKPTYREIYGKLQSFGGSFYDFIHEVSTATIHNNIQHLVGYLVLDQAYSSLEQLQASIKSSGLESTVQTAISNIFYRAKNGKGDWGGSLRFAKIDEGTISDIIKGSVDIWDSILASPQIKAIFRPQLEKAEADLQNYILDKSLEDSDGGVIQLLDRNPTPESLRNLVLIASAPYENYRTVHANSVIKRLVGRSDWPEIFKQALAKYPKLAQTQSLLDHWDLGEVRYISYQGLPEAANGFARAILSSTETNPLVLRMAKEVLPLDQLYQMAVDKGFLTEDSVIYLKDAEEVVQRGKGIGINSMYLYHLQRNLRDLMFDLPLETSGQVDAATLARISAYTELARYITRNSQNTQRIEFALSDEVFSLFNSKAIEFIDARLLFEIPQLAPSLLIPGNNDLKEYILNGWRELVRDESDLEFINQIVDIFGNEADKRLKEYYQHLAAGTLTLDRKEEFLEPYMPFIKTRTPFSEERKIQIDKIAETQVGRAITDLVTEETERLKLLFDYACYSSRMESRKINLLVAQIRSNISGDDLVMVGQYLRWLPDERIDTTDTPSTLQSKFQQSMDNLQVEFERYFPNAESILQNGADVSSLERRFSIISQRFNLETRRVKIGANVLNLPTGFIRQFVQRRREAQVSFIPELARYLIQEVVKGSTAYTVEDLVLSQIGDTEDQTGRRRGQYTAETLLSAMNENVEASLVTWASAIKYQQESPQSPLFIIANERTGPADLAAEYLPHEFAQKFGIAQSVDYEKFYAWFKENQELISTLYEEQRQGKVASGQIPQEVLGFLGMTEGTKIVPMYRLKIPSSLDSATAEPEGVDLVLNFLKLTSVLGGRALFMDESTRSAPRSIECLYNVIKRRREALGNPGIRFFGKLKDGTGQSGTILTEVSGTPQAFEIGFIDPWTFSNKPVNDDSEGFVPQISGHGVVEVIRPPLTSVSPYGLRNVQDFWKQIIANEVSIRFDEYVRTGGEKRRKEDFSKIETPEQVFTQQELKDRAFAQTYKALIIDLDGTAGSRGLYEQAVIGKILELAESGIDVVVATARSSVDNSAHYDGSVASFLTTLGELSETQKSHIYLATENGGVIKSLASSDLVLKREINEKAEKEVQDLLRKAFPQIKAFKEESSLVLRDFDKAEKGQIMDKLKRFIEKGNLGLLVMSDSSHSVHLRAVGSSKRNILDFLESRGININHIAKIGDSPAGNDRPMMIGAGSFSVGQGLEGTAWTVFMHENGGGPKETAKLLERLHFEAAVSV